MRVIAALSLVLAACLVQDPTFQPMCRKDTDCDDGEVCGTDFVCYGNLPSYPMAAIVTPPGDRLDLAPTEIIDFEPSTLGSYSVSYAPTITLAGRVVLTDTPETSAAARIVLRRRSRLPNAPDLIITTASVGGKATGEPSFSVEIPPSADLSETWSITIFPDDTPPVENPNAPSPADLAPPYRRAGFVFTDSVSDLVIPLGGGDGAPGKKVITGRILSPASLPIAGYDVRAFGRFSAADPLEVASSRSRSDATGQFTLLVPAGWQDDFEVRLIPPAGEGLPQIVLPVVHVADPSSAEPVIANLGNILLPEVPAAVPYVAHVEGVAPGGGTQPVKDATVTLSTVLVDSDNLKVSYQSQAVVDGEGDAQLMLIPGSEAMPRAYQADLVPASGSEFTYVYGMAVEVGEPGEDLELGDVPLRVLVSGVLLDENGLPAAGVSVLSQPTVPVANELLMHPELPAAQLLWPEAITDDQGRFAVWLDHDLVGVALGYQLTFEPPTDSLLPRFYLDDLFPVADSAARHDLGEVTLPQAAYAHGNVIDGDGVGVPGSTLRVYQRDAEVLPCAVKPCPPSAVLVGQAVADEAGFTRLALPRL